MLPLARNRYIYWMWGNSGCEQKRLEYEISSRRWRSTSGFGIVRIIPIGWSSIEALISAKVKLIGA